MLSLLSSPLKIADGKQIDPCHLELGGCRQGDIFGRAMIAQMISADLRLFKQRSNQPKGSAAMLDTFAYRINTGVVTLQVYH